MTTPYCWNLSRFDILNGTLKESENGNTSREGISGRWKVNNFNDKRLSIDNKSSLWKKEEQLSRPKRGSFASHRSLHHFFLSMSKLLSASRIRLQQLFFSREREISQKSLLETRLKLVLHPKFVIFRSHKMLPSFNP